MRPSRSLVTKKITANRGTSACFVEACRRTNVRSICQILCSHRSCALQQATLALTFYKDTWIRQGRLQPEGFVERSPNPREYFRSQPHNLRSVRNGSRQSKVQHTHGTAGYKDVSKTKLISPRQSVDARRQSWCVVSHGSSLMSCHGFPADTICSWSPLAYARPTH